MPPIRFRSSLPPARGAFSVGGLPSGLSAGLGDAVAFGFARVLGLAGASEAAAGFVLATGFFAGGAGVVVVFSALLFDLTAAGFDFAAVLFGLAVLVADVLTVFAVDVVGAGSAFFGVEALVLFVWSFCCSALCDSACALGFGAALAAAGFPCSSVADAVLLIGNSLLRTK